MPVMFVLRTRPLRVDAKRLLSLRLSLNTPVVSVSERSPGPAQAAIVVHTQGGKRHFTVAIRSLREGVLELHDLDEKQANAQDVSQAVAAALSFAESMGFLFDDDVLKKGGAGAMERALARCEELLGKPATASRAAPEPEVEPTEVEPTTPRAADEELLLDTLAEDALLPAPRPEKAAPSQAPGPPSIALTKFRTQAAPPTDVEPKPTKRLRSVRSAVGLVRLVRRAAQRKEAPKQSFLTLLGHF
jgi:hypothetical protein